MTAVYKRELRSYFTSMVGYVFIAILIFFVGIYFMAYNLFGGYPSFGYVLLSCTIIFMVAVPILTMRSMAEDRRGKTDQLLLTSPVSLTGIVLGKYLAMVTVLLVPILLICFCPLIIAMNGSATLTADYAAILAFFCMGCVYIAVGMFVCPLIIAMNGSATLTADYAAILAFFCMGCVYIAVGMFVSALTESQIIAAVGTFAALLVLYLWTDLVSFLPDSLAQLLSSFDFQGVLDNFAYYSVFDLGGLLLYLSMAAVFVFLTVQVLQRRKGITSAATTAVVLAIAVVVNLVVGQLPSDLVERDISDNSLYTVSDTSVDYLSALERDVELVVLASEDTTDQRITKFLHNYAALSGHLSLSFVDPVEHPSALTEYEADQNTVVVRCADTGRQRVVPFSDILVADLMSYYTYGTYTYSEFDAEGQLTSAVDYVTSDNSHILYLAENHGESALGGSVTDAISKANLSTSTVSLLLDNGVPDDCSLLVFNQPQTDLSAGEAQMVRDYLEGGGQVMILLTRTDLANFNAILADYGLAMAQGYIGDTARYYAQYGRFYFSATLSASSPITAQFGDDDLTLIYGAHGMTQCDPVRDTITVTPFMTTTESGYSDAGGQTGTYILGAQAEEETDGGTARLTVFTTESVVDQSILTFNPSMVNLDIFLNAATSGMEDISAISIPAKSLEITYNTVLNPGMWSTLYLAVIPLGVLIGGLAYWIKRRKL